MDEGGRDTERERERERCLHSSCDLCSFATNSSDDCSSFPSTSSLPSLFLLTLSSVSSFPFFLSFFPHQHQTKSVVQKTHRQLATRLTHKVSRSIGLFDGGGGFDPLGGGAGFDEDDNKHNKEASASNESSNPGNSRKERLKRLSLTAVMLSQEGADGVSNDDVRVEIDPVEVANPMVARSLSSRPSSGSGSAASSTTPGTGAGGASSVAGGGAGSTGGGEQVTETRSETEVTETNEGKDATSIDTEL